MTLPNTEYARGAIPRPPAVRAESLVKTYSGAEAVRGIDLLVRPGEIFGLLGPTGAGKSTTIAMLCALVRPTSGSLWVAGRDVRTDPVGVRRSIGVVFQSTTLDGRLTVEENLRVHAALHGLARRRTHRRITSMLALAGLTDRRHALVSTLPGGAKRRLEIVRSLLHHPEVLLMDEPTVGLGPHERADVWLYLHRVHRESGATVLLSTQYPAETDHCDRMAVLDRGRVGDVGTPAQLRSRLDDDPVRLVLPPPRSLNDVLPHHAGHNPRFQARSHT
ncbi:ATP-binding cassette domain-containing protein [Nocardiopsis quinghaiensis]|uniref:ATP-binding cassette domain-containing protein n=1 Tax=Nocardiopsis quinghaiensis TaxID=464995 RepID=UPI001CC241C3|nr:ATP-binding cassette domain-containing protein [Nocardiopsis quinghaiensis]